MSHNSLDARCEVEFLAAIAWRLTNQKKPCRSKYNLQEKLYFSLSVAVKHTEIYLFILSVTIFLFVLWSRRKNYASTSSVSHPQTSYLGLGRNGLSAHRTGGALRARSYKRRTGYGLAGLPMRMRSLSFSSSHPAHGPERWRRRRGIWPRRSGGGP